jgi:hypothetical protein
MIDPPIRKVLLFSEPALYRVAVQGHILPDAAACLGRMRVISTDCTVPPGVTILKGELRDQAELSGILNTLYDMHMPVLQVTVLDAEDPSETHDIHEPTT